MDLKLRIVWSAMRRLLLRLAIGCLTFLIGTSISALYKFLLTSEFFGGTASLFQSSGDWVRGRIVILLLIFLSVSLSIH
jgi:hypothetical protein